MRCSYPNCYRNRTSLRIIDFHALPPGMNPCLCSAQMTRRVNLPDSYWCTVLKGFTVGTTLKIHSACFCCWKPPELKLISGDSDAIDSGAGEIWRLSMMLIVYTYDSHNSHVDISLHSCTDTWRQHRCLHLLRRIIASIRMWMFCLIWLCIRPNFRRFH